MCVMNKSRILIIGSTGYLGRYLVDASTRLGHPTFVLVREYTIASDAKKADLIESFKNSGVTVLFGDLHDHKSLVNAIEQVDVVFSMMGHEPNKQLADQINIISAIKEAGNIKRYFPSEYGYDVDRVQILEPAKTTLAIKSRIRQEIKKAEIPFTFVCSFFEATNFLRKLGQVEATAPPDEKVFILGDGNMKAVYVSKQDIATYAIKAADDPRVMNKILHVRPPSNFYSLNELVSIWENKTNRILERIYLPEEEVLKKIKDSPHPFPFYYAIAHASFVKGEQMNLEINPSIGVEASELYPEVKYTTIDECFDKFI